MAFVAHFQGTAAVGHVDTVRESVVKLARESREEPGTIRYEFYQHEEVSGGVSALWHLGK